MNVFKAVKQSVTTRQAAEHFGIRVGRNGMCVCPFHADKNPSMKVDRRFHCFGCQADGDVIDFVSRLEAVSPKEAALMLAQEFSIPYEDREPPGRRKPKPRQETPEQRFCRMERYCFRVLSDYYHLLRRWKRDYAPKMPEEAWHPLFVEALQKQSHVEYLLDVLLSPDKERLFQLHAVFHMDEQLPFQFEWDWLAPSGLSTKDFIAPSSFEFRTGKQFRMGKKYGAVSFLQILAPELNDRLLADFLDMESSLIVSMHIQSVDQVKAIKTVKRKITDLDRSKIEEQKKAVRAGYDMDIIPSDLATYGSEAKKLLQDLQSRNERMFLLTFLVLNTADNPRQLGNNIFQAGSIAQKYNCQLTRLDFQQEEGLMSCLPLGLNQIEIQRGLTTSSTAIFVPFTTQELFQNGKEALYYGINALSNNLIMVDRKLLKNPNGLILGTPGSGKSFSAKREIANCFLLTSDDVIICDPEAEYAPLVERLHGQVIKISPTSTNYINPMDLNLDYSDDESPLSLKSDFILSLCELIVGGKEGLQPVQKTIIDRCVRLVYQTYLNDPRPENMPILEDLYNLLREQEEKEAQYIATALEIYVTGSLNVFNHQSNVDINNRIVCYDIKELGKQLKKIGMLVVQDQVWNRVTINRAAHKSTRYYIDEMHLLLKEEQTAAYTVEIWKRFRKWGGIPTGITQNVKDLLSSREVENIFENSDFVYMLNQAGGDRQILAKQLGISTHQLSYVTHSGEGEGLLFYGSTILPFVDHFPKNTELYRIMTTKPQELKKEDE